MEDLICVLILRITSSFLNFYTVNNNQNPSKKYMHLILLTKSHFCIVSIESFIGKMLMIWSWSWYRCYNWRIWFVRSGWFGVGWVLETVREDDLFERMCIEIRWLQVGRRNEEPYFHECRGSRTIKRRTEIVVVCIECMCVVGGKRSRRYGRSSWWTFHWSCI